MASARAHRTCSVLRPRADTDVLRPVLSRNDLDLRDSREVTACNYINHILHIVHTRMGAMVGASGIQILVKQG
jgi:hypothetical protein